MPIREFKCELGHITEKLLIGDLDNTIMELECEFTGITDYCDQFCHPKDPNHKCRLKATRVDIPSKTSFRLMPGGSGGFYNPSKT